LSTVKVTIYEKDSCYDIPSDAAGFINFFQEKIDSIPEEFKSSAQIDVEASAFYDSALLGVCVYYFRPKTKAELEKDAQLEAEGFERERLKKLADLERLKRELGL